MFPFSFLSVMAAGVMAQEGGEVGPLGGKGRGKVKGKETWPRFSSPLFVLGRGKQGRRRRRRPLRQEGRKEDTAFSNRKCEHCHRARIVRYVRIGWARTAHTKPRRRPPFCSLEYVRNRVKGELFNNLLFLPPSHAASEDKERKEKRGPAPAIQISRQAATRRGEKVPNLQMGYWVETRGRVGGLSQK